LIFEVSSGYNVKANAELIDQFGKIVKKISFDINKGVSHIELDKTNALPTGIYSSCTNSGNYNTKKSNKKK
jgi:hypothetical protein